MLSEAMDDTTKFRLMDLATNRVPFSKNLMAQYIKQGREIGLSFQSDNEDYKMPVAKYRIVFPVAMGYNSKGNLVIRGWHAAGQSEKAAIQTGKRSAEVQDVWRLFKAENIKNMWTTERFFDTAPPGYNPNDKHMESIIAAFNPTVAAAEQAKLLKSKETTRDDDGGKRTTTQRPIEPMEPMEPGDSI